MGVDGIKCKGPAVWQATFGKPREDSCVLAYRCSPYLGHILNRLKGGWLWRAQAGDQYPLSKSV